MPAISQLKKAVNRAFTLIELLIVVAIIAILAAIAVPNFLEAQVRAKVARVKSDMRTIATGLESYHVDHGVYPEGTDNPDKYGANLGDALGSLAPGFYGLRTTGVNGEVAGATFHTLTTPIAYIPVYPPDPFQFARGTQFPYCYRNAKTWGNGWILTSVGPDQDLLAEDGRGNTNSGNIFSTAADANSPARLGDINERYVIHALEGTGPVTNADRRNFKALMDDLKYDPSNGTISDGDLFRVSGSLRRGP